MIDNQFLELHIGAIIHNSAIWHHKLFSITAKGNLSTKVSQIS